MSKFADFVLRFLIGYCVTLGVVFVTRFTFYTYIDSFQPPEIQQPIKVLNEKKTVYKGEQLFIELTFKKPEQIFVTSVRQIACENNDLLVLEPNTAQLPVTADFRSVKVGVTIPNSPQIETPQTCTYQVRGTGAINEYREYNVVLESEPFILRDARN